MRRTWLVVLVITLALSGCWNRRELETLGIIIGAGYDWDPETEEYVVTAQMARPAALRLEGGGGGGATSHIFAGRGKTVFDASRNLSLVATRKLWWGHVQVVVVGEEAARHGLLGALNFMQRDGETRTIYWLMVTPGKASEILRQKASPENIPALGLSSLMRTAGATSFSPSVRLLDVLRQMESPSAMLVAVVTLTEEHGAVDGRPAPEFRLNGSAVFHGDKMVGYLTPRETRGVLWLRSKVRSALLPVPCPGAPDRHVSVEVVNTASYTEPYLDQKGRPAVRVLVRMEGNVGDQDCRSRFDRLDEVEDLEQRVIDAIQAEIDQGLEACRALKADCFGFGTRFSQELPRAWKLLEKAWPEPAMEMRVTVTYDVTVRATGAELRPAKPK